jgi:hypothetical protein
MLLAQPDSFGWHSDCRHTGHLCQHFLEWLLAFRRLLDLELLISVARGDTLSMPTTMVRG